MRGAGWSRFWREATPGQRMAAIAFALMCAGLLALVFSIAKRPRYATLYAGLQQDDAARVMDKLRELKVDYRVRPGGVIEAPAEEVDRVRLELAGKGVPSGGQSGFELFDRAQFGLSDFGEKINYQRALEGELARTISHLDSVEEARVHIAIPEDQLYESEQSSATASVVLQLAGGRRPTPAEVRSVAYLVAGAVGELTPEAVTILDTTGRLLAGQEGVDGEGVTAASSRFELKRAYEKQIEEAVQTMLAKVVGPGKAVVRASAEINFERVESESETYQPVGSGTGVLQSRQTLTEQYRGTGETRAAGVPGVASNTGNAAAVQRIPGGADQYQRDETRDQYLVSRVVEKKIRPPGDVKRLTLSVFVDEGAELGDAKALQAAVAAAAGLDPAQADSVVITRLAFQEAPGEPAGTSASAMRRFYFSVGRDFAAIVLTALFLIFARKLLRRNAAEIPAPAPSPAPAPAPEAAGESPSPAPSAPSSPGPSPEAQDASFDPEKAASVVRRWLSSEGGTPPAGGNGGGEAAQNEAAG